MPRTPQTCRFAPNSMTKTSTTLGVIIGNRDFFPDQLVAEARDDVVKLFAERGIRPVMVSPEETKLGGIETHADARRCADLFKRHRDEIDGVLVVLPNFGDEKGVADTLKLARLDVPVLDPGLSRRPQSARRGAPARRLLRQDLRLQQPGAGRHQILAHHEARLAARFGELSRRPRPISCGSAAW